eukprot:TRINITY_DN430_c0_g1_i1.p1 TRINITY_DN430_c0_g1~~TRINITY_DN430_c0_g1_i1.p1  ORF type:complete len:286 (+),score=43.84 TRINITY_DN430_c0_g1_i1:374-1231(+)
MRLGRDCMDPPAMKVVKERRKFFTYQPSPSQSDGKASLSRVNMSFLTSETSSTTLVPSESHHSPPLLSLGRRSPIPVRFPLSSPETEYVDASVAMIELSWRIRNRLKMFPKLFERFGQTFMDNFDENVMRLSRSDFQELDDFNTSQAGPKFEKEALLGITTPVAGARKPPLFDYVHANVLGPQQVDFVNRPMVKLLGFSASDLERLRLSPPLLIHKDDYASLLRLCMEAQARDSGEWAEELIVNHPTTLRLLQKGGDYITARIVSRIFRGPLLAPVYHLVHVYPI